ncbi:uncharacterized protein LOC115969241 [Quercus lobata]|uniref:uncharacterized protein LOC115969241 n=1 Tax=Quercus lobata TaxID=97700 RepID=UPI0012449A6A|nr:uncharacterized protein LOC115969241 [Quercus lobata]XP_030944708.1 uncharacterized protein LOC115969241 [Quercus lobata]
MVQDQHHAIQIIAEKVTQLYKVAKEIRSLLTTRSHGSRNKKEPTYNRSDIFNRDPSEEEEDSSEEEEDSSEEEEDSKPRLRSSKTTNKPSKHGVKNGKHPASLGERKMIKMSPKVTTPPDRYERQWARINSPSSSRKRKHESESETQVEGNLQKKRKVKKELKF